MLHTLLSRFAAGCDTQNFFDFPTWYKYLIEAGKTYVDPDTGRCEILTSGENPFVITDLSLVALAVVDIALRLVGIVTIGYIVWGGIQFVTAQGEPDKTKKARSTIINALIGLVIAMIAVGVVGFIGTRIGGN